VTHQEQVGLGVTTAWTLKKFDGEREPDSVPVELLTGGDGLQTRIITDPHEIATYLKKEAASAAH